jgi:thiaminase
MLHYLIKDYKKEMIEYSGHMPNGWAASHIADKYGDKSDEEKKSIYNGLLNTFAGNNFQNGVKHGYINIIRETWAKHNKQEYVPLPKEVIIY